MSDPSRENEDALAEALRETFLAPPDEATTAQHVAAMVTEARATDDQAIPVRRRAHGIKGDLMTRFRTAALAVKLAALTLVAALATAGLATAGVISLPESLPGVSSDRATAVHDAIQGSDPAEDGCAFGQGVAETASDEAANPQESACGAGAESAASAEEHGKPESEDVEAQGATPEEGAGADFGESVSDRASGGEPQGGDGRDFGESVSDEAQELVPRPEPQGGPETGEIESEQGQETGETRSQQGQETAGSHGGPPQQD
jgi:hypothetical protein